MLQNGAFGIWRPSLERRVDNGAKRRYRAGIQKRALRIMYPELKYHEALMESNLKTLTDRRDDMCVQLLLRTCQTRIINLTTSYQRKLPK